MKTKLILLIIILGFLSCSNENLSDSYSKEMVYGDIVEETSYSEGMEAPEMAKKLKSHNQSKDMRIEQGEMPTQRKLITRYDIRFQVKNLDVSSKEIESLTKRNNGFISAMDMNNSDYSKDNQLTIRIPSDIADQFINDLEKQSLSLDYKRTNSRDVTEEYVDIESRLATKRVVLKRYIELLRNKAKTLKEVLDAEDRIRRLQEEIEAKEGRLKFLEDRTSMSTIVLNMYQLLDYKNPPRSKGKTFIDKLVDSFQLGWHLILGIVIGLVSIWPLVLIVLIAFFNKKRIVNIFRKNK